MKKQFYLIALCGLMMCSSCTTLTKTSSTVDVQNVVRTYPQVADLVIQQKVTETKTWSFAPFHWGEPKLATAKGNLIADLLQRLNADILLEPQFSFEKTAYGARVLTVTGFPATYKNFRKASPEDLRAIDVCNGNPTVKYNSESGGLLKFLGK